jgi:crotonobetainyl-CoA:carnitine CoA-transferase CaiB-like acyl-CoA transferase
MDSGGAFLKGYRALDLTDVKGQLCGRVLAGLGMEVVKIEPPGGDPVRELAPFVRSADGRRLSATFAHLNAGKFSKILDLKKKTDRDALLELAASADVLLESFAPGELESMGLGYERLTESNPGIIMASITGFGQIGPKNKLAYNDLVATAESGFLYISGAPELPPCKPPETQAYYFASLYAAVGVLAALYRRERTGEGDYVDVSMQECLATQEHIIRLWANEKEVLKRAGSQHASVAPAKIFRCRDGYVYLYVTRQHWKLLLDLWKGHPPHFDGPEWLSYVHRRTHVDDLNPAVEEFVSRYTVAGITELLQSQGIPCVPVNTPLDFINDEHVQSRGFIVSVDHAGFGKAKQAAMPFLIDGIRPAVGGAPVLDSWRDDGIHRSPASSCNSSPPRGNGPLHGMRIVSFDHVLAGPYGVTILAELGADVIKVESRKGGLDPFRFFGEAGDPNLSPRFLEFNRNKRSFTVNLKHPTGQKILHDLVAQVDAVLDNYSVDVVERIGLGHDQLRRVNSDIVNLRMPGLGTTGPKRHFATLGVNIASFTGLTYLWNYPGNTAPPIGSQTVLPDYVSGVMSAILIISGVLYRDRWKKGAFIDLAQAEATAFMIGANLMDAVANGSNPEPMGNASLWWAPYDCYPCAGEDRWCVIAAEDDQQWSALARVLGGSIEQDGRFKTNSERLKNRDALNRIIAQWTKDKNAFEVRDQLQKVGVPAGVVQTGRDLSDDPHLKNRGFIVAVENPRLGRVVLPNFPLQFANAKLSRRWEFPELGRDTETVLRDLVGYSATTIAGYKKEGALD